MCRLVDQKAARVNEISVIAVESSNRFVAAYQTVQITIDATVGHIPSQVLAREATIDAEVAAGACQSTCAKVGRQIDGSRLLSPKACDLATVKRDTIDLKELISPRKCN